MDVLYWIAGFVVLVPLLYWFKKASSPPREPRPPIAGKHARAVAELGVDTEWIDAFWKLSKEDQAAQRVEFSRRLLDHSERLLALGDEILGQSDSPILWTTRRTKELLAAGKSFDEASSQAMAEMDIRFPPKSLG